MRKRIGEKGISPVIATVLLVAMVIVIAMTIFFWVRGLSQEAITKFGGENVKVVCGDVQFSASYSGGILTISNYGNVPIYDMALKITSSGGNYQTTDISSLSNNWSSTGLGSGGVFTSADLSSSTQFMDATQILAVPVLLGNSNSGQQTYTCDDQYGEQISI